MSKHSDLDAPKEEQGRILIIDDDENFCILAQRILQSAGYAVAVCHDGESGLRCLNQMIPDVLCLDLDLPNMRGIEVLEKIRANHRLLTVIVLTADSAVDSVVAMMRKGAWDYLTKPIERARLLTIVRNAVDHSRMSVKLLHLQREVQGNGYPGIVGSSSPMKALFRQMDRVAQSDITVLVHGESGTGKELVARAIHDHSGRREGSFVALNCAAVPESLQESELFGHERGAFTGATARRSGRFELADGGTLFLDEVGELSLSTQAKLLRVLQEHRFQRLGSSLDVTSDFRLIAATHRDLLREVHSGRFREDLYFRIAVFELELPPLRDRSDDIVLLAETFLRRAQPADAAPLTLSADAVHLLRSHEWPGNVRELQNAIERAVVLASDGEIKASDLPARLRRLTDQGSAPLLRFPSPNGVAGSSPLRSEDPKWSSAGGSLESCGNLEDLERRAIEGALRETRGNVNDAVRILGIGRSTLYRKIKQYKLVV
jgi:DNA-binding NtrC family response regulator